MSGKEFTLRYDDAGLAWDYRVVDRKTLYWRNRGEAGWRKETYRAMEADEKLIFFGHMQSGSRPSTSVKIALDLLNGLTTCVLSKMGTEYYGSEVSYKTLIGIAEMDGVEVPKYVRHEFTDELVGRGFTRTWADIQTSMHLYCSPHASSWTIYTEDQTLGTQWCAPCIHVKLRDGVYLFNQTEDACNGAETCTVMNEKTLRVCGFEFRGTSKGVDLGLIGAFARPIGGCDVRHLFGPQMRREKL